MAPCCLRVTSSLGLDSYNKLQGDGRPRAYTVLKSHTASCPPLPTLDTQVGK